MIHIGQGISCLSPQYVRNAVLYFMKGAGNGASLLPEPTRRRVPLASVSMMIFLPASLP